MATPAEQLSIYATQAQMSNFFIDIMGIVNVKSYGATGNGVTDDTIAIQAAINMLYGGGILFFPKGTYKTSTSLTIPYNGITLMGDSEFASAIKCNGSFNVINATNLNGFTAKNLAFASSAIQTTGAAINCVNSSACVFEHIYIYTYHGIVCDRGSNIYIKNIQGGPGLKGNLIKIYCSVASTSITGIFIDTINALCNVTNSIGILIDSGVSGCYISKCDLMQFGFGICVQNSVSGGLAPSYVFFNNVLADTSSNLGIYIVDGYTLKFVSCWANTSGNYGIDVKGGSDIWFTDCTVCNNGLHGMLIETSGSNENGVHVRGGTYSSNGRTGTGNGIFAYNEAKNFDIIGVRAGRWFGGFGNTQVYGISVYPSACDNYIITNNNCRGNVTGGIYDGGTGVNKVIDNNLT